MIKLKQFDWSKLSNSIPKDVDLRKQFIDFLKNAVSVKTPEGMSMRFFFSKFNHELPLNGPINECEALITFLSIVIVADRLGLKIDHPSVPDIVKFLERLEKNNYKMAINEPWFSNVYQGICDVKQIPVGDKFSTFKNKFGLINCKGDSVCNVLEDLLSSVFNSDVMNSVKPVNDKPSKSDSQKLEPISGGLETAKVDASNKKGAASPKKPIRPSRTDISIKRLEESAKSILSSRMNQWNIKRVSVMCGTVPVLMGSNGVRRYAGTYSDKISALYTILPGRDAPEGAERDLYVAFTKDPQFAPASLNESNYLEVIEKLIWDPWTSGRG